MKYCLTGAAWIFITLGLPIKLAAMLMFILILIPLWIWATKLIKEQHHTIMKTIADFGKPGNWQP